MQPTKTISVTLSEEEMNDFRKVAEAEGVSMRELARRIIRDWLRSPDVQAKLAKEEWRIMRDWLRSPDVQAKLAKDVEERFLAEKNDEDQKETPSSKGRAGKIRINSLESPSAKEH